MIAKNEGEVVERCLSSFIGDGTLFDQVVLVDTGSADNTKEIAKKFGCEVYDFKWVNDFSVARNFALSKVKTPYAMWNDLDDVLLPENFQKIKALKPNLARDIYLFAYDYAQYPSGKSACLLQRERVHKNDPSRIHWKYPVHEVIDLSSIPNVTLENHPEIIVTHKRTGSGYSADMNRNVTMLEAALQKPEYRNDPRLTYYIGKELMYVVAAEGSRNKKIDLYQKTIKYFKKFLNAKGVWSEDQVSAQFKLAKCYHEMALLLTDKKAKWMDLTEEACFTAIKMDYRWAEPYYLLGMLAWDKQNWRAAIHWFEICRSLPKPDVLAPVEMEYHTWLPRLQLCVMYDKVGDIQKAYERNKEALEMNPTHPIIVQNDQMFRKVLQKPQSTPAVATSTAPSVKIGWLAVGIDLTIPQFRIRTYNISNQLRKDGYDSEIFTDPSKIGDYDVIIFDVAFNEQSYNVMAQAKSMGKRVLVNVCEALFEFNNPWYTKSMEIADMTICCSEALKKLVSEKVPIAKLDCIEDAVESDFNLNCNYEEKEELAVGWCGMGGGAVHVERLRPLFKKYGYKIITIHEHVNADVRWDLNTWQSELAKCDIAIAPTDHIRQPCKSNNKLTTYMALGLPAITSPLFAYTRITKDGETGFVAETDEQWEKALIALKDVNLRKKIGQAGKTIARAYALPVIASYWRNRILEGVKVETKLEVSNDKSVDIIIPTYDNPEYLKRCLESIESCTDIPYNIIVVDAKKEKTNFSQSINLGLSRGKAPYVVFLNDDCIVSKGWIKPLIEQMRSNVGIVGCLSNCDKGFLHNYDLNGWLPGVHKFGDINPQDVYNFRSPSTKIYQRDWIAFYAVLTSRKMIEKVGLLDEDYKTGSEDLDWCIRMGKLGYRACVNENSFIFHYGGISRKRHEDEDPQTHIEEDKYNNNRINVKYGKQLIVIQTGYGWEHWGADCKEKGLGGSEQWAAYLSEAMVKWGVRVVVFAPTGKPTEIVNGVEWHDSKDWDRFISMNHIDVCMVSRYVNFFESPIRATKKFLFAHDIFAMHSQENGRDRVQEQYDKLDGIFVLSEWHRDFFADYHKIPKDKLIVFNHGLDLKRFGL
jgi:GT2 family glycosyltransferase/tetratricopeptide (TPR) repeat protein